MKNILVFIVLCVLVSCKEKVRKLPYYDTADFTPKWQMPDKNNFHTIPAFNLLDQEGKSFTNKDVSGKIYVANFFFTTCPGICPKMAVSMEALQKEFLNDDEVLFISHSVTPDKDSVPVLKKYADEKGAIYNKWKLLTGQKSQIYDLGRKAYYVEEDLGVNKDSTDFLHTENFVLVDENRHIRGIYNSLDKNSMAALTNDIKILEKE